MKRFSETEKWKDEWFGSLKPIEKLVFLFILDVCDNAGFFELNTRLNTFLLGVSEEEYLGAIKGLNRGLLGAKNGTKYFIKNFLFHQKNLPLNIENNAHKQIILIINQNKELFDFDFNKLGANKGLFSPIGKGKGKLTEEEKKIKEKFKNFISWFNLEMKKDFKGDAESEGQFNARNKEGYNIEHYKKSLSEIKQDKHHIDTNFKYVTPEFITRSAQLEKWVNTETKTNKENNGLTFVRKAQ